MTELFLVLSVGMNIFGLMYVRWIIRQYNSLNEHLKVLFESLIGFEKHVESIHESEMYYGDSTLQTLTTSFFTNVGTSQAYPTEVPGKTVVCGVTGSGSSSLKLSPSVVRRR